MSLPTDCSGEYDLAITPGTTLSRLFRFSEDVSAYTFTAQAFLYADSSSPLATFTVDQSQANLGLVVVGMSAGDTDTYFDKPKRYWWRLVATLGSTVAWPLQGHVLTDQLTPSCDCDVVLQNCDVTVVAEGIGVPGPQGPQGPPGSGSGSDFYYEFTQASMSTSWVVHHALGKYPNTTVILADGSVPWALDIDHVSLDELVLTWEELVSGKAVCS